MGEVIVKLADALARGDDAKLSALLNPRGKEILGELTVSGEWSESVKPLEAVRVIFVGDGGLISGNISIASLNPDLLRTQMQALLDTMPSEVRQELEQAFSQIATPEGRETLRDQLRQQIDALKAAGAAPEVITALEQNMRQLAEPGEAGADGAGSNGGRGGAAGSSSGARIDQGVLIALQDPRGAYLTGWGLVRAGDTWLVAPAPSSAKQHARAVEFDGIGPAGFVMGSGSTGDPADTVLVVDPTKEDNATEGEGGGGGGEPSQNPGRKNTPSGPVTVPGVG